MPTKTVMLKLVEAFGTGDVARVDQFISPDYVDHQGFGEGEVRGATSREPAVIRGAVALSR
jgi:hypothetical protein